MDEEFYIEESDARQTKIKIIILLIIFVIGGVFAYIYVSKNTFKLKTITYEVGEHLVYDEKYYLKNEVDNISEYKINLYNVPNGNGILNKTGNYEYTMSYKKVTKTGHIRVVDTTAPVVELNDLTISLNEEYQADDFLLACDDYSKPCLVSFDKNSDAKRNTKEGVYNIKLIIEDSLGNKTKKEVKLTVAKDSEVNTKKQDLAYASTEPALDDFNGSMILKYSKGVEMKDAKEDELHSELLEILDGDLHEYIDPIYVDNMITDTKSIIVFNKYGYVIGYAIKVELDNGLSFYLKNNESA